MDAEQITAKVAEEHVKLAGIMENLRKATADIPAGHLEPWFEILRKHFFHFRAHMTHRIALEEMGGFLNHVLARRPTLARDVEHIRSEHRDILASIEEVQQGLSVASDEDLQRIKHIVMRIDHVLSAVKHHTEHEDLLEVFRAAYQAERQIFG